MLPCIFFLLGVISEPLFAMQPRTCDEYLRWEDPMIDHWRAEELLTRNENAHSTELAPRPCTYWTIGLGSVGPAPSEILWHPAKHFECPEETVSKALITCTWDDVPHLSAEAKTDLLKSYPPHMRDARSKGLPMLGAGAIYPVSETEITVADFAIPDHWHKCYGLDVGWNFTGAAWLARDPDTTQIYLYSAYKQSQAEPSVHAAGIKARGDWIPGVIDPASTGASQHDGKRLVDLYTTAGLKLTFADNSVEAGIYKCWELLSSGQLKIFASCLPWFVEYRNYHRDEKGKIIKKDDHIMDAMRYAAMSGLLRAVAKPVKQASGPRREYVRGPGGWMG